MLLPLKKSGDKADAKQFNAWHPNFVETAQLPDVKVVRTSFFVNSASLAVLISFLIYFGYRELNINSLKNDLASIESEITTAKAQSDEALALFGKFQAEEKKLAEILKLTADTFVFSDFIMHLGAALPEKVLIDKVLHRGNTQSIVISATVEGLDIAAGNLASNFVKQLQDDQIVKTYFSEVSLTKVLRNEQRQVLNLELSFTFKPIKK